MSGFDTHYDVETLDQRLEDEKNEEHDDKEASLEEHHSKEERTDTKINVRKSDELLEDGQDKGLKNVEMPLKGEQDKEKETEDKKKYERVLEEENTCQRNAEFIEIDRRNR